MQNSPKVMILLAGQCRFVFVLLWDMFKLALLRHTVLFYCSNGTFKFI